MVRNKRRKINIGDIYYVSGGSTKVEIVGNPDARNPLCLIHERGEKSKFKIGRKYHIYSGILYPRKGRAPKI
jgi:hypothetical protein